jgi:ferredoxin-NADP reductase
VIGYPSRLLGRTEVAQDTMAFQFERPRNFLFKAGQSIDLTLPGLVHGRSNGLTHTLSIASCPSDDEVLVTTRIRDTAFKRALSILPIGSEVRIEGPMGSFTLHNNTARPAVLLAGGIGIAPFLSILAHAAAQNLRHPIFLFYANRYLEDAAFIDALGKLERANPRFRFVPTFTRMTKTYRGWKGETGHISGEMLSTHVGNLRGPIFYVAGPPTMVAAARRTLIEAAVDEDDIRTEEFAGY